METESFSCKTLQRRLRFQYKHDGFTFHAQLRRYTSTQTQHKHCHVQLEFCVYSRKAFLIKGDVIETTTHKVSLHQNIKEEWD